eukprot:NODE_8325_length_1504_cov_8.082062.p1 GENE.NODE_8325_length_1504_cov_8.082062~~NODE_8325_length_1504_cov_8.082062.p1  ORF type:complete len:333 (+),score=104.74 NODE_8325_length_1504_cov_8.082062:184-1182(+)
MGHGQPFLACRGEVASVGPYPKVEQLRTANASPLWHSTTPLRCCKAEGLSSAVEPLLVPIEGLCYAPPRSSSAGWGAGGNRELTRYTMAGVEPLLDSLAATGAVPSEPPDTSFEIMLLGACPATVGAPLDIGIKLCATYRIDKERRLLIVTRTHFGTSLLLEVFMPGICEVRGLSAEFTPLELILTASEAECFLVIRYMSEDNTFLRLAFITSSPKAKAKLIETCAANRAKVTARQPIGGQLAPVTCEFEGDASLPPSTTMLILASASACCDSDDEEDDRYGVSHNAACDVAIGDGNAAFAECGREHDDGGHEYSIGIHARVVRGDELRQLI